jgi:ATP-binding protein involved in chromosome partitioning
MTAALAPAPVEIGRAGEHDLRVRWADGHESVYPARSLRLACPCAGCVDEMTGAPLLNPASVPAGVHPLAVGLVGRYAVHLRFSDGHASGIYSFEKLRAICPCPDCAAVRAGKGKA